jgi:hypothetical protein
MMVTMRPGFRFKEGRLYVSTENETLMIESWPDLAAVRTRSRTKKWHPFVPAFRLLRPAVQRAGAVASLGPRNVQPGTLDPELERQTAFRAFRFSIPPEVVEATERFSNRQWSVLKMCQRSRYARELAAANPALGFCLANLNVFRQTFSDPIELTSSLARLRQREVLSGLGFPGTESCARIFSRIVPEAVRVDAMVRFRDAIKDEEIGRLLSHLPCINAGVLALTTNPRFRHHLTPRLLGDVAVSNAEEERPEAAALLQNLQLMWAALEPGRAPKRFQSVASLRAVHAEVCLEFCRHRMEAAAACSLPAPPLPGTEYIQALTTVEKLREEGTEQQNCVGTYSKWVAGGHGYVYRVLRPERATLAIEKGPDGDWCVQQLRAQRNGPVSEATLQVIGDWLRTYSVSV